MCVRNIYFTGVTEKMKCPLMWLSLYRALMRTKKINSNNAKSNHKTRPWFHLFCCLSPHCSTHGTALQPHGRVCIQGFKHFLVSFGKSTYSICGTSNTAFGAEVLVFGWYAEMKKSKKFPPETPQLCMWKNTNLSNEDLAKKQNKTKLKLIYALRVPLDLRFGKSQMVCFCVCVLISSSLVKPSTPGSTGVLLWGIVSATGEGSISVNPHLTVETAVSPLNS